MFYDPVNVLEVSKYTSPTLSMEDTFHGPQWVPETTDSTKPHMYYVFFHIHTYPWYSLIYKSLTVRDKNN